MQQFEAAKARCPGALVLFRMGDFYELFGDDARRAADLLDLTLTSRDKGPDAVPIATKSSPTALQLLARQTFALVKSPLEEGAPA